MKTAIIAPPSVTPAPSRRPFILTDLANTLAPHTAVTNSHCFY